MSDIKINFEDEQYYNAVCIILQEQDCPDLPFFETVMLEKAEGRNESEAANVFLIAYGLDPII